MSNRTVLSTAYFPPVTYMALVARNEQIFIEKHENFQKQTYRNRARILTANGVFNLVVPVIKGRSAKKIRIDKILIDNSVNWQENHLRTIRAAYASAPFFDFYFPEVEDVLNQKHKTLFELNMSILNLLIKLLRLKTTVSYTDEFLVPPCCEHDFRNVISPKNKTEPVNKTPYIQVFQEKYGFVPALSVLDLLMNLGNETRSYLKTLSL